MEQEKLTNQKEVLPFLCNKYPKCFFLDASVKPLKIGIFQDLAKDLEELDLVSKRLLRLSLRHYTSSWRYLAAVKSGVARINLAGDEGDVVEEQHALYAAEQLKESKEKAAKHRENNPKAPKKQTKHKGYSKTKVDGDGDNVSSDPKKASSKAPRKAAANNPPKLDKPANKPVVMSQAPLQIAELVVGNNALVKLGKEPMPVTIIDIGKDGISVQLKSGMTVKVQQTQLFSLQKAASQ